MDRIYGAVEKKIAQTARGMDAGRRAGAYLAYNIDRRSVYIPNEEVRSGMENC